MPAVLGIFSQRLHFCAIGKEDCTMIIDSYASSTTYTENLSSSVFVFGPFRRVAR